MAKQTQSKDQSTEKAVKEVSNTDQVQDAFGDIQTFQDSHNPYSKKDDAAVEIVNNPETEKTQELAPVFENPAAPQVIQPVIQEPIKPTLTDQVVYEDFSQESTVKVENANGVTVNLSGTAAKILKNLDATTKIVK